MKYNIPLALLAAEKTLATSFVGWLTGITTKGAYIFIVSRTHCASCSGIPGYFLYELPKIRSSVLDSRLFLSKVSLKCYYVVF